MATFEMIFQDFQKQVFHTSVLRALELQGKDSWNFGFFQGTVSLWSSCNLSLFHKRVALETLGVFIPNMSLFLCALSARPRISLCYKDLTLQPRNKLSHVLLKPQCEVLIKIYICEIFLIKKGKITSSRSVLFIDACE